METKHTQAFLREAAIGNIKQVDREIENHTKALTHTEKILGFLERRKAIEQEMFDATKNEVFPINPTFVFENNETYKRLKVELGQLDHESKVYKMDQELVSLKEQIQQRIEEIARLKKTKEDREKEIAEVN